MVIHWPIVAAALLCVLGCGGGDGDRATLPPAAGAGGTAGGAAGEGAAADEAADVPAPAHTGALRFLALGDSYTKGEGVPAAERWPVQLAARLRSAGLDLAEPQVVAETGWRTDDLDAGINAVDPRGPFDLVTLLIGVNNQFQNRSAGQYRVEFDALLRRAVGFAGGDPSRVVVLSIPDYGATPYGQMNDPAAIAAGVAQFNAVNRELSRKAGVRYVDVTPVSGQAATDATLTAPDDLHPSGRMYAAWADLALPEALAALGGSSAEDVVPVER
jgi:lysophospholipase L1-like esterase